MTPDLVAAWTSLQMQLEAHRPDRARPQADDGRPPTPVCVLTGFLGAGKTSLLAHLLTNPPAGLRVQGIVNDVGSLQFDPTLVAADSGVRVELGNGCGCCERTAELADALGELAADPDCDLIVLEASGAADPLAVAQVVAADPNLVLDRIVTVVSAARPDVDEPSGSVAPLAGRQVDSAHNLVVSGCDMVGEDTVDAAVERLVRQAPGRPITRSSLREPASHVLLPSSPRGARPGPADVGAVHRRLHVVTVTQTRHPTTDQLRTALDASRPGLVRAKGRLLLDGRPHLVQLTPQSIEIAACTDGANALTLIGVEPADVRRVVELVADEQGAQP